MQSSDRAGKIVRLHERFQPWLKPKSEVKTRGKMVNALCLRFTSV